MKLGENNNKFFKIPQNLKDILNTTNYNYENAYDLVKLDIKKKMENNYKNNIHFYDIPQHESSNKESDNKQADLSKNFKSIHKFREIPDKPIKKFKKTFSSKKSIKTFESSLQLQIKKEEKSLLFLSEM